MNPKNPKLPTVMPQTRKDLAAWFLGTEADSQEHVRGVQRVFDLYCQDPSAWPMAGENHAAQVNWAGLPVPLNRANLHFLVAGVPGTGKTISFRMLLQSVFSEVARDFLPGTDRAVIYDPKQEFYPILRGMGVPADDIAIMNPFDTRSYAWDLATDYTTPAEAFQLAKTIIPCPDDHSQPFFPKSAAAILTGVICSFIQERGQDWDLANVVTACLSLSSLEERLKNSGDHLYAQMALGVLGSGDTRNNVFAELSSHLFEYLPIAASWRAARKKGKVLSLRQFVRRRQQLLLLGANQTYSEPLQVVNRLLLKRLSETILDHVDDGQWEAMNRTWVVLDELRELGEIPGLADLINKGRSRGVCAVLGFQDYPGLKESFGENTAHEITATCAHRVFLRLGGESAEWASQSIGKTEVMETEFSFSNGSSLGISGNQTDSTGESYSTFSNSHNNSRSFSAGFNLTLSSNVSATPRKREADAVLPSEIAHLPGVEEGDGLTGFVCQQSPDGTPIVRKIKLRRELLRAGLIEMSKDSDDCGFQRIDDKDLMIDQDINSHNVIKQLTKSDNLPAARTRIIRIKKISKDIPGE